MNTLIIEDEAPAQRILERYVTDTPDLRLVGVENNAMAGLKTLDREHVDLLLLDVNLPKLSGIDLLRTLRNAPKVILTTAYPDYALEGYELDVVDYLLKPFSFARFLRAIRKARPPEGPLREGRNKTPTHFFVRSDKVLHRVDVADLLYCKAEGDFVRLVLREAQLLIGRTLADLERELRPMGVVQTHRSYLLNVMALRKLTGNRILTERGEVPVGRAFRAGLLAELRG